MRTIALIFLTTFIISCSDTPGGNKGVLGSANTESPAQQLQKTEEPTHETEGQAQTKVFNIHEATLVWTAYKTPKKAGVKGTFKTIETQDKSAGTAEELLSDLAFSVKTQSISTNDVGRDQKILGFFFNKMLNTTDITGHFGKADKGIIPITLKMNDKELKKEFTYKVESDTLKIAGLIDIVGDFAANEALSQLNEACKDLHEGKTWSEVNLLVQIPAK